MGFFHQEVIEGLQQRGDSVTRGFRTASSLIAISSPIDLLRKQIA